MIRDGLYLRFQLDEVSLIWLIIVRRSCVVWAVSLQMTFSYVSGGLRNCDETKRTWRFAFIAYTLRAASGGTVTAEMLVLIRN